MKRRQLLKAILAAGIGTGIAMPLIVAAKVGRPASPVSVAGVNRRHRRRRRRRIRRSMRLSSLPYGCNVTRLRGGVTYYYCSGIWYRPVYEGTTVVYIVDDIESGANTDLEFYE